MVVRFTIGEATIDEIILFFLLYTMVGAFTFICCVLAGAKLLFLHCICFFITSPLHISLSLQNNFKLLAEVADIEILLLSSKSRLQNGHMDHNVLILPLKSII